MAIVFLKKTLTSVYFIHFKLISQSNLTHMWPKRPDSRCMSLLVCVCCRGWNEREERRGLQTAQTWYLVTMQWWKEWNDYVFYQVRVRCRCLKRPYSRYLSGLKARVLMPSAHGPIFCRKELPENVGAMVRFFLGLSQCRRLIFCHKQLREKNRTNFFSDQKLAHTDWFFIELLCLTIAGEVLLLDDVTPIYYRTEVSAHGSIFCRKQLREIIGAILYRSKSQRTRTNFHSVCVCAGHYSRYLSGLKNRVLTVDISQAKR